MTERSTQLQTILADTVTRLFTDVVTKELIESAEKGAWPERLWQHLEEGGLTLPLVPESHGGAGGTWEDAHIVIRAAGRHTAPVPLAETIVASELLARTALPVPTGPLTLAPVRSADVLRLTRASNGWRLSGTATRVPWGARAGHVVVLAEADAGTMVALLAQGSASVTHDRNLALEPRDTLTFADTVVLGAARVDARLPRHAAHLYGALARSAQMAGALEAILQQSVQYATERRQFGRPIGAFQTIQHYLAVLAGHAAAAGIAAERAFQAAGRGECEFEVAAAKIRVGEAAGIAAGLAHQVHGAIGFTYEHSLHFWTRRLWSWRAEFGSESRWAADLGRAVTERGAAHLWPDITAR